MNKEEKELYELISEISGQIVASCGAENIEDTAFELEEEEYERYVLERNRLVGAIVRLVKLKEELLDFHKLNTEIQDEEFWENIEKDVINRTDGFMKVTPFRKLEKLKRWELLDRGFDLVYVERENREFMIQTIGDEILVDALLEILLGSEYVIATMYISKRRFMDTVKNNICLQEEDLKYIWDKYEQNLSMVQAMASVRTNARMENRIKFLLKRIDDLENLMVMAMNEDD